MDFRALTYFVQVANLGGITRASAELGVAQPALTRQIQRLEQDLGSRLFVRESRGVKLTDAGKRLFDHATRILRDLEYAQDDIRGLAGNPVGRVVLGIAPTLCPVLTPPLYERLRAEQPRVELTIAENFSSGLSDWLGEGRIDLAVTSGPVPSKRYDFVPLFEEEMVLVTTPGQILADYVDADTLASMPLVLSDGLRALVDQFLTDHGRVATVLTSINAVETMRRMAERGLCATVLPRSLLGREPNAKVVNLRKISEKGLYRSVVLSWKSSRHRTVAVQTVFTMVQEISEKLKQEGAFRLN